MFNFNVPWFWNWKKYQSSLLLHLFVGSKLISGKNNVLDLGCGEGFFFKWLDDRFRDGYLGGDFAVEPLKRASMLGAQVFECDLRTFGKQDLRKSFDNVVILEVLEHLSPKYAKRLVEVAKHYVNPGGRLIVSVPYLFNCVALGHVQFFTCSKLKKLIDSDNVVKYKKWLVGIWENKNS